MRSVWIVLLVRTALLTACGSDDGDRAAHDGGRVYTHGDGQSGETFGCGVERWAGPDEPLRHFACEKEEGEEGPFTCHCDGREQLQSAAECEAALSAACGVDAAQYEDYCTFETLGTCWPVEAGGFRCACNGEDAPLIERAEQRCNDAIFRACGATCEDEAGRCEPMADATGFECACEARTTTRVGEVECIYALDAACHPECEHAAGQCFVASDHRGVECRCGQDRELTTVLYNDVGHDDCDAILEDLCGPNPDQPETCERMSTNASGNCRLPSSGGFSCNCTVGTDSHVGGGSPAAASCLEQLMQFCPEAFE